LGRIDIEPVAWKIAVGIRVHRIRFRAISTTAIRIEGIARRAIWVRDALRIAGSEDAFDAAASIIGGCRTISAGCCTGTNGVADTNSLQVSLRHGMAKRSGIPEQKRQESGRSKANKRFENLA